MTSTKKHFNVFTYSIALIVVVLNGSFLLAQAPIAGEDFDGGTTNGNLTATMQSFSPDNSGCNGQFMTAFGCTGSRFDRFGILNREAVDNVGSESLPFDLVDETVLLAVGQDPMDLDPDEGPNDTVGILRSTKLDNVVGFSDTVNGSNPDADGRVNASWTFDVSSGTNLQISIDFAAVGNFDGPGGSEGFGDFFTFTYSIDGGAAQTAFDVRGADTGILYSVAMENGNSFDRFLDPFFSEADWLDLTTNGPTPGSLDFHPDDIGTAGDTDSDGDVDGGDFLALQRANLALTDFEANFGATGGDRVAQDGLIPVLGSFGLIDERANQQTNGFGTFDEQENNPFVDPLVVNGTTQLNNEFLTVTVPIIGSGNELTLELEAIADGGLEYFVFDNILIEGDLVPNLTSVPEPTSFGLLILGFGLVATNLRKRR